MIDGYALFETNLSNNKDWNMSCVGKPKAGNRIKAQLPLVQELVLAPG